MKPNYTQVTEVSGELITFEQLQRIYTRYHWLSEEARGKDVLEAACGSGSGLGMVDRVAKSLVAGDLDEELVEKAKKHYGSSIAIKQFDACELPFEDSAFDVVVLFEAIYYLPDATKFVAECKRVLRPGGLVLISTANKDLFDFNPSPWSHCYYGVKELDELLKEWGFCSEFFGGTPITETSLRQKILRPIKKLAVDFGLMPKTMRGKKFLKKLVFGRMMVLPQELKEKQMPPEKLYPLVNARADKQHKVIYCRATLQA